MNLASVLTRSFETLGLRGVDIEGVEIRAIQGASGMDAIFVYEDWPRSGIR